MILHITLPEDWAAARESGQYAASTRGATIAEVGYLHASQDAAQVRLVGGAVYADRPDAPGALPVALMQPLAHPATGEPLTWWEVATRGDGDGGAAFTEAAL